MKSLRPGHNTIGRRPDVPLENIRAMYEAVLEYA
jgi:hypothetical protein